MDLWHFIIIDFCSIFIRCNTYEQHASIIIVLLSSINKSLKKQ